MSPLPGFNDTIEHSTSCTKPTLTLKIYTDDFLERTYRDAKHEGERFTLMCHLYGYLKWPCQVKEASSK